MVRTAIGDVSLVGRDDELNRILGRLIGPLRAAFVIAGPAGVGKTRLAIEVSAAARAAGFATATVVATKAAASIPFGAFAPLLPDIDSAPGGLTGLLQGASELLVERNALSAPLLLFVDDVQLLDDGSAALVHQLVRTGSCSLIASLRTPARAPDPVTSLWKEGIADRIDLRPLVEADIEVLAASVLGAPVTGATLRWLFDTSQGNPLYVRELLRGASESGSLVNESGVFALHRPWQAPDRLVELVAARIADLDAATIEVVELACLGEPLGIELLETITHPGAVETAERSGLVTIWEEGRRVTVALVHPIYSEVLRQRIGAAGRRRLSGMLAAALRRTGMRRHDDTLRVATWELDAGIRGDAELLAAATAAARKKYDMELTIRLGRAAVSAGAGMDAALALGEGLFSTGRHDEAEEVLAHQAPRCERDEERARIARARFYNFSVLMGDRDRAMACATEALGEITDHQARMALTSQIIVTRVMSGDIAAGLADALPLLESDDLDIRMRAAYVASWSMALLGRTDEGFALAEKAYNEPGQADDGRRQNLGAVIALAAGGHLREAEVRATLGYDLATAAGDKDGTSTFLLMRGWIQVDAGKLAAASRSFRDGAAIDREVNDWLMLRWSLGGIALAEGMAGNPEESSAALAEFGELADHWSRAFDADLIERGHAWAKVARGEVTAAREMLESAVRGARRRGEPITEARLLHDLVRLGPSTGAATRLKELAAHADGILVSTYARHAEARATGGGAELEAAAEALEQMGALLSAAEAYEAASCGFARERLERRAIAAGRRAVQVVRAAGGTVAMLRSPVDPFVMLTVRESEVANLAVGGATSQQIADRLYLSVRTVQNHLQHVYTKLGVTSKDELADVLTGGPEGPQP